MAIRNFCPACWPTSVAGPGGSTARCTEWAYASPFTSSNGRWRETRLHKLEAPPRCAAPAAAQIRGSTLRRDRTGANHRETPGQVAVLPELSSLGVGACLDSECRVLGREPRW